MFVEPPKSSPRLLSSPRKRRSRGKRTSCGSWITAFAAITGLAAFAAISALSTVADALPGLGIVAAVLGIVAERGKMQNPVTGSGGMLTGVVSEVGPESPLGLFGVALGTFVIGAFFLPETRGKAAE